MAYEVDPNLVPLCKAALAYARKWLEGRGVELDFEVRQEDFVLANTWAVSPDLFSREDAERFDFAILNPPYFKLSGSDERVVALSKVVHGQPNIYALFMAVAAGLLKPGGGMVSITPRSFAAGEYFRHFRRFLLAEMKPEHIHVFGARDEAFREDSVLQENVILRLRKACPSKRASVVVTKSVGADDLGDAKKRTYKLSSIVDWESRDAVMKIPTQDLDDQISRFVSSWPGTLMALGVRVSTGPVVAFRATGYLRRAPVDREECVPLLWLQNVRSMKLSWPVDARGKPQYIVRSPDSARLLVPNGTCVVMRRFTAKEEPHRLVAAPLRRGQFPGEVIGLENHLNYLYRLGGELSEAEAMGISAVLDSELLDQYFRISNGHTQVNATELRSLRFPSSEMILRLGRELLKSNPGSQDLDRLVMETLEVPKSIRRSLERRNDAQTG
ncbi:MAG: Eco57I restriction-modification methylase domain-containing protein [Candidatus Coatesbacteria bacterium]